MASMDDLEKKVEELQKQLREESEKTSMVEKELKDLSKEVSMLKGGNNSSGKMTKESGSNGMVNKKEVTKEESSSSSDAEEKEISEEKKETEVQKSSGIIKEGFLEKKGAIRHNWRKRYVVLDSDQKFLLYYVRKGDAQPKGVIPLVNATCYAHVEKKGTVKPLFFNIRTETRDFLMRAETNEEKGEWVKLIKTQCIKGEVSAEAKKHLAKKASSFIGRTTEEPKK